MWGAEPTRSALRARDRFAERGAREILTPGVGYGRNAKPFVDAGMSPHRGAPGRQVAGREVHAASASVDHAHAEQP